MSRLESRIKGNLTHRSFSQLLSDLWHSKKSGGLFIKKDEHEKNLSFKGGQIAVAAPNFPEKDFLSFLSDKGLIDSSSGKTCENFSVENRCSLLHALQETGPLSPSQTWSLLEEFLKKDIFPVFDWGEGAYELDSENIPPETDILFQVSTPNFILQGIRQMRNHALFQRSLPEKETPIQFLSLSFTEKIRLTPPEKYLLNLARRRKTLENIYQASILAKRETQRILYALLSLRLISLSSKRIDGDSHPSRKQPSLDKIFAVFNAKFSYVYKYISKELGPVAFNLVEKSLEEVHPHLSPLLRDIKLDSEGRLLLDSTLKSNMSYADDETRRNLLKDLNEMLIAEVLTVKKNLGNDHESTLVSNLEKIGEWN